MKRLLRSVLSLLIVVGLVIAVWPLGQHAYGIWNQRQLQSQWQQQAEAHQAVSVQKPKAATAKTVRAATTSTQNSKSNTQSLKKPPPTRLIIPEIGLDAVVVQGFDERALARGPGHDPRSALPGEKGNCVLAAHRNVYGSWMYKVDELWAGSEIKLRTPDATHIYHVLTVQNVAESDHSVRAAPNDPDAPPRLTIITCALPHSPFRVVVTAEMTESGQL